VQLLKLTDRKLEGYKQIRGVNAEDAERHSLPRRVRRASPSDVLNEKSKQDDEK